MTRFLAWVRGRLSRDLKTSENRTIAAIDMDSQHQDDSCHRHAFAAPWLVNRSSSFKRMTLETRHYLSEDSKPNFESHSSKKLKMRLYRIADRPYVACDKASYSKAPYREPGFQQPVRTQPSPALRKGTREAVRSMPRPSKDDDVNRLRATLWVWQSNYTRHLKEYYLLSFKVFYSL